MGNHSVKVGADLRYGRNLRVPSDNDRTGVLNFATGPTSKCRSLNRREVLLFAAFSMGEVSRQACQMTQHSIATCPVPPTPKEFQKREFFYGQA